MSPTTLTADGPSNIAGKRGWFIALGIVMIVLGVIAWVNVVAVTLAGAIVIGAALAVGGVFQIVHAFTNQRWRGFIFGLLSGVLYLIGGILMMNEPVTGAIILTLLLAAAIIVGGVVRIVLALRHRDVPAWGLVLFSGIVSFAVGCLLYINLPWSGLWLPGALIAIELLVQGAGWLYFGIALRSGTPSIA